MHHQEIGTPPDLLPTDSQASSQGELLVQSTGEYPTLALADAARGVLFEGEAIFRDTVFRDDTTFEGSVFQGGADFSGAVFERGAATQGITGEGVAEMIAAARR